MRVSPSGEIALLDWEDVDWAPGNLDLAWHLMSSQTPERWSDVIGGYRADDASLNRALPAVSIQALLCLADAEAGSHDANKWIACLGAASRRLNGGGR